MTQSSLIDLKSYDRSHEVPNFLGIYSQTARSLPSPLFQALSPHVMEWEQGVWIFDLRFTKKFWQTQAQIQGISGLAMIEEVLNTEACYDLGVFAKHPWQLVFILTELKEEAHPDKRELINLQGPFGQSLLKRARWPAWFAAIKVLCSHWQAKGSKQFKEHELTGKIKLLQASMNRLGVPGPNQLPMSTFEAMKRRFGKSLATLWEWSLLEPRTKQTEARGLFPEECRHSQEFPWTSLAAPTKPKLKRYLENTMTAWEHIEPLLKDDLDQLCQQEAWSENERVCKLAWRIQLFHGKSICLSINFRNPHSLHGECGRQDTAAQQARYAYESMSQLQRQREDDLDLPDDIPLISWELIIEEKISIPPKLRELFKQFDERKHPMNKLLSLENKLHVPLDAYKLTTSFDPMKAFAPRALGQASNNQDSLWGIASSKRPLYYHTKPRALAPSQHTFKFLERTGRSWWQESNSEERDYYLAIDHKHQTAYWAFKKQEQWYTHGIFS